MVDQIDGNREINVVFVVPVDHVDITRNSLQQEFSRLLHPW
jgi:hypothetical protein